MLQKKNYRLLTIAIMATVLVALFAIPSLAANITGGFGKIILPDDDTYVLYQPCVYS